MILLLEQLLNLPWFQLTGETVCLFLYDFRKRDLETAREVEFQGALDNPCDTALARLGVDTDDSLIGSTNVRGVKREVRELPRVVGAVSGVGARFEAFLDGVLVGAGEGAYDKLATVGCAGVDGDFSAVFNSVDDGGYIAEVDIGVDALGVEVECEGDEVDVSGSFAVAEEAAFNAVRTGHLG